jgi:hypothetical protein
MLRSKKFIAALSGHYSSIVFLGAVYDIVSTGTFAFAGLAVCQLDMLRKAASDMGMSGVFPAFDPAPLMFVNLIGSMVLSWAVLRLIKPLPIF